MWGFLGGTLVLIVIQTVIQPAAASKLASGSGVITSIVVRMLSPTVAGIPQTKASKTAAAAAAAAGKSGGPTNKFGLSAGDTGAPTQPWGIGLLSPIPGPNSPGVTTGPQDPTVGGILKP